MPCRDGGYEGSYSESLTNQIEDLKNRNDLLARVACAALRELESNGIADMLLIRNSEVRDWWANHKAFDEKEGRR